MNAAVCENGSGCASGNGGGRTTANDPAEIFSPARIAERLGASRSSRRATKSGR
jgi:hypothetical protein